MGRNSVIVVAASALLLGAATVSAQPPQAESARPGMGPGAGGPGGADNPRRRMMGPGMMDPGMMDPEMGYGMMGPGMGPGMMGPGMGRGMAPYGFAPRLELDEQQQERMEQIMRSHHQEQRQLMNQMAEHSRELQRLYAQEEWDSEQIGAVYGEIFDIRRQMIEHRVQMRNQILDTLDEDQRRRYRTFYESPPE